MWLLIVYTTGVVNGIGEGDVGRRKLYTDSPYVFLSWCHSYFKWIHIKRQLPMTVVKKFGQIAGQNYISDSFFKGLFQIEILNVTNCILLLTSLILTLYDIQSGSPIRFFY